MEPKPLRPRPPEEPFPQKPTTKVRGSEAKRSLHLPLPYP